MGNENILPREFWVRISVDIPVIMSSGTFSWHHTFIFWNYVSYFKLR